MSLQIFINVSRYTYAAYMAQTIYGKSHGLFLAVPKEIPAYRPDTAPVRRRQPLVRPFWQEERDSAPCFTFHLRPRVVQFHHPACKLLCCLSGKPTPTVSYIAQC